MKLEAYNIESLRNVIRRLQKENHELKELLHDNDIDIPVTEALLDNEYKKEEFDEDQGGRIIAPEYITDKMAERFSAFFSGRKDVFARRGKNGGYFPQCINRWNNDICPKQKGEKTSCELCFNKKWKPLDINTIKSHLLGYKEDGTDVIGIYPLMTDGTCNFIVFDFDNHESGITSDEDYTNNNYDLYTEVDALRKICELNGIKPLVERSRSGKGAHLWIFFNKPIMASLAREFGFLLLEKGSTMINLKSFNYYDRMYPSQNYADELGNLIALPLQGKALKNGNSAFVDENWNAYPKQWDQFLNKTSILSVSDIKKLIDRWSNELEESSDVFNILDNNRGKPWRRNNRFNKEDVEGNLHVINGDGIYIDILNVKPRLQNRIRSLAAFDNPEYYKNKRLGFSNYNKFSSVYLGKDVDGYIKIPRGLLEKLQNKCKEAEIDVDLVNERIKGKPIRVSFTGDLYIKQNLAVMKLSEYDDGILNAATAFGKTVVSSYMIAERGVNTLILLNNKGLAQQWESELNKFLLIDEELPEYITPSGKKKRRKSHIGKLQGNMNTMTGIIDIAMIQSLSGKDNLEEILDRYGMIIMDECHHAASTSALHVLEKVKSKYLYGITATTNRRDNLEKIIYMMLGPVRHTYSALEKAKEQGIEHYVIPRYTKAVDNYETKENINAAYKYISDNENRNNMVINDVKYCVSIGRTPLVLTRTKEQVKYFLEKLGKAADFVLTLYGDNSDKNNISVQKQLDVIRKDKSVILIATGQKAGEGFNYPRLDTLMLVAPISFSGRLEQYVGRLNRDYDGKKEVLVFDYVDSHMRYFNNMYNKRLRTYAKIGYTVKMDSLGHKQESNAIFDSGNYEQVFERDLIEANKSVIVSSRKLRNETVKRFLSVIESRQERGVNVIVITTDPDFCEFGDFGVYANLIDIMINSGVYVIKKEEVEENFAIVDDMIVWHGGMNLLGKEDYWDNLMRVENINIAAELKEIALGNIK